MTITNKLRVLSDRSELALIVRVSVVLLCLPLLLRRRDIRTIVNRLTPDSPTVGTKCLPPDRTIYLCRRMLHGFGRLGYNTNCLRRNLLCYHCLRNDGVPVVLHFGVKPAAGELAGHAWLMLGDRLLYDDETMITQFVEMFSLPDAAVANPAGGSYKKSFAAISLGGD